MCKCCVTYLLTYLHRLQSGHRNIIEKHGVKMIVWFYRSELHLLSIVGSVHILLDDTCESNTMDPSPNFHQSSTAFRRVLYLGLCFLLCIHRTFFVLPLITISAYMARRMICSCTIIVYPMTFNSWLHDLFAVLRIFSSGWQKTGWGWMHQKRRRCGLVRQNVWPTVCWFLSQSQVTQSILLTVFGALECSLIRWSVWLSTSTNSLAIATIIWGRSLPYASHWIETHAMLSSGPWSYRDWTTATVYLVEPQNISTTD